MMQAQQTQLAVTANQSLQVVQTLLRVSFGCVAYLRDLLPDDNFTDGYLTTLGSDSFSQSDISKVSGQLPDKKPPPSGSLKVKTIKKDFSTEGNKLLQYLEEGIFDALEKQYLRSFIFAVYLDDEDPDNIVEAYTFNFSYHAVPGSTSKVPIMTLGERLENMSLGTRSTFETDPAAEAVMKGKVPTLGEVKRSVKNLVKTLITSMQLLHALPKRRFGTFKLFYLDNVPDDYEPPHFTPGDASNKYFFTTHTKHEVPERVSFGSLSTPHHGVELHVASISEVIPRGDECPDDTARFGNLVNHETGSYSAIQNLTLAEREKMINVQQQDALLRKVVWDAEAFANPDGDGDAEGECDPDYQGAWDNIEGQKPRGMRRRDGTVIEMDGISADESMHMQGFPGVRVEEPESVKIAKNNSMHEGISPTQVVEPTQCAPSGLHTRRRQNSPLSYMSPRFDVGNQEESAISRGIETQLIRDLIKQRNVGDPNDFADTIQDSEMLDLETQLPLKIFSHPVEDPITSYPSENRSLPDDTMDTSQQKPSKNHPEQIDSEPDVQVTECDCGVPEDEDYGACQCEGSCGRWLHIWCMGYHSVDDPRLPAIFHCFGCRLRNDPQIEVLDSRNLTSEYISKFKDLSFFRRALKIIEIHRPDNVTRFKELLGCEVSMAGQAWKRLEAEGFITLETMETDDIGFLETQVTTSSRKGKGKSKSKGKQRARKNLRRAKYIPVPEVMTGKAFQEYFEPAKEAGLLGMKKPRHTNTVPKAQNQEATSKVLTEVIESQTQESQTQESQTQISTQADPENQPQSLTQFSTQANLTSQSQLQPNFSKRKSADEEHPKSTKRIKISVGFGISLED